MSTVRVVALVLLAACGLLYLGWRGFRYVERPEFCNSCHGVERLYETWFHSAHRPFTNCNSCHLPAGISSLFWMTRYGVRDLYVYLAGDTPDVYRSKPPTPVLVRDNCARCHETLLREIPDGESLACAGCHRHTPHRLH